MSKPQLHSVPLPIPAAPACELTLVGQETTPNGSTIIEYEGSDGNSYHEFMTPTGRTWLLTRRPKQESGL